jgi:Flp pilus assembly protein TadD
LKSPSNKRDILICLALILFVIIIYWQAQDFKFVYYDDGSYVAERTHVMAGLTWDGFKWAMAATEAGFWHPLTWLSLMIDRELFGNNPGGYHWTNVILHIINTLLLFFFLKRATKAPRRSAFVALLFAVHPLHVESVAWVSQRKDLLCTLFGFASLLAYVNYSKYPNWRRYTVVIIFFILGLMSKPMIVTFPFVMLLMDYWPLQRLMVSGDARNVNVMSPPEVRAGRRPFVVLLLEKAPLVVLSVLASVLVVMTEHKVHALTDLKILSIMNRFANAIVSYVKYIAMMFWPANLTFFYPHPVSIPVVQVIGALLLLSAITIIIILMCRRKPYLFTGWFWYAGTLVPVIGLIQVGPHALADRYTYVPLVGLFIILVWGVSDLAVRWRFGRHLLCVVGTVTIVSLSFCSWLQASYWRNSITLFEHALQIAPDNYIALNNLGQFYVNNGKYDKGLAYMHKGIQVKPKFGPLYYNVGLAMYDRRDYEKAIEYFAKAERMSFDDDENRRLLGDCYRLTGRLHQAVDTYGKALEINSHNTSARYGMALALMEMGRNDEAIKELRNTLSSAPLHLSARKILMLLALKKGDMSTVVAEGQKALANGSADAELQKMMEYAGGEKSGMDKAVFPVNPSKDTDSENN